MKTMSFLKTLVLAQLVLGLSLVGTFARADWDHHHPYWDHEHGRYWDGGYWHECAYYHHHHGYWSHDHNGLSVFINID